MKYVVYVLLAGIVVSLFSALFYLRRDSADSHRMLRALQIRVALSGLLIAFLVVSYLMGWLES